MPRSVYTTIQQSDGMKKMRRRHPDLFVALDSMSVVNGRGDTVQVRMPEDAYVVVDTVGLADRLRDECRSEGVSFCDREVETEEMLNGGGATWVDCSGFCARHRREGYDPIAEYIFGGQFDGEMCGGHRGSMVLVIGPGGGTNWICPSFMRGKVDVVFSLHGPFSCYPTFLEHASIGLRRLVSFAMAHKICEVSSEPGILFNGTINMELIPPRGSIYNAGQAAGIGGPGSGDCFRRVVNETAWLAKKIAEGVSPWQIYLRRKLIYARDRTLFAAVMQRMPQQATPEELGQIVGLCRQLVDSGDRGIKWAENYILSGNIPLGLGRLLVEQRWFRQATPTIARNLILSLFSTQLVGPRKLFLSQLTDGG